MKLTDENGKEWVRVSPEFVEPELRRFYTLLNIHGYLLIKKVKPKPAELPLVVWSREP